MASATLVAPTIVLPQPFSRRSGRAATSRAADQQHDRDDAERGGRIVEREDETQHVADGDELRHQPDCGDGDPLVQVEAQDEGQARVEHHERCGDGEIARRQQDRRHAGASPSGVERVARRAEARRLRGIVRDEDDDRAARALLPQQAFRALHAGGVERAGRLVEEQAFRAPDQRARQRQPLPLAGRERARLAREVAGRNAEASGEIVGGLQQVRREMRVDPLGPPAGLRRDIADLGAPDRRRHAGAHQIAEAHRSLVRIEVGDHPQGTGSCRRRKAR